jgi:hypothetical protein
MNLTAKPDIETVAFSDRVYTVIWQTISHPGCRFERYCRAQSRTTEERTPSRIGTQTRNMYALHNSHLLP